MDATNPKTERTWTTDEIASLFSEAYRAADEANREATRGPGNPFGDEFESLVWCGSIAEARDRLSWPAFDPEDWEEGTTAADLDGGQWEDLAIGRASGVVGHGRPVAVVFYDGGFATVFCEVADEATVRGVVGGFYGDATDSEESGARA